MTRFLPRSAPAAILLLAALFLSAAGGAVAGGKITGAQIKNGTITHKDVKDGTLGTKELSPAAKAALTYELEYYVASSPATPVPNATQQTISVECPDGYIVIGGDVVFADPEGGAFLDASGPMPGDDIGWFVTVINNGGSSQLVTAQAHCANLG